MKICSLVDIHQISNLMVKEYSMDLSFFHQAVGKLFYYSEHKVLLSKLKQTQIYELFLKCLLIE